MKFIEKLSWILDKEDRLKQDEECRINIEFVHSLGLKCDSVGWSSLDLQSPRADEILSAIDSFCKKNGWKARGNYRRVYTDYTSDWYEINTTYLKDDTACAYEECEGEQGKEVVIRNIRAYKEMRASPKYACDSILVPERFRDACIRHNVADVEFCWARDKGRYKAEQYFYMYCKNKTSAIATDRDISIEDKKRIELLGGSLPKIANIFYSLQMIDLQDCYIEDDIPDCGIVHAYRQRTYDYCGRNTFLIHKDLAKIFLEEKVISPKDLHLAKVVKELPLGYVYERTELPDRPNAQYIENSIAEYEKLKSTPRPIYAVPEKEALKLLRSAKKERKDDFNKALPKAVVADITDERYIPVLPYYLITNGGYFSDEYEFLPYAEAVLENKQFFEQMRSEELLEEKPEGVVFARCPDGDRILLCNDGKVIRMSHEEPDCVDEWPSLAQFVADSVNE